MGGPAALARAEEHYNAVERAIFEELFAAVASREWPATWTLDLSRLSLPLRLGSSGTGHAAPA